MTIADFAIVCQIRNLIERYNFHLTDYPRVKSLYDNLKGKYSQIRRSFSEACFRYWLLRQKPPRLATKDYLIFLQNWLNIIFIYAKTKKFYLFGHPKMIPEKSRYFCIQIIYWRESVDGQLFSYCGGKWMDRQDWNVKETVSTMSRVYCFGNIYIKYYTI